MPSSPPPLSPHTQSWRTLSGTRLPTAGETAITTRRIGRREKQAEGSRACVRVATGSFFAGCALFLTPPPSPSSPSAIRTTTTALALSATTSSTGRPPSWAPRTRPTPVRARAWNALHGELVFVPLLLLLRAHRGNRAAAAVARNRKWPPPRCSAYHWQSTACCGRLCVAVRRSPAAGALLRCRHHI